MWTFCLRVGSRGGRFYKLSNAVVQHEFWDGSILKLAQHFSDWSAGDSALFYRYPKQCYYSVPNVVEFMIFIVSPLLFYKGNSIFQTMKCLVSMFLSEVIHELLDVCEFQNRRNQLLPVERSLGFVLVSQFLANFYVFSLEIGRLSGHVRRGHFTNICPRFDWHCGRLAKATD